MIIWVKTAFSSIIYLTGLLVVIATISACGNRGPLYLKKDGESRQTPGHILNQDDDKTGKKDKRE